MRFLLPKTEARLFLGLRDGLDGLAETRLLLRESEMRLFWGFVMDWPRRGFFGGRLGFFGGRLGCDICLDWGKG